MNKVLITKYLSSVKNDDLPIFGAVVVNSNPSVDKDMVVEVTTTEPFNVSELGSAEVLNNKTKQPITSTVIGNQMIRINRDNSKTMHLIFNGIKYKPVLTDKIQCFGSCILDLSTLKYQSNLSTIQIDNDGQVIGSISDLPSGVTNLSMCNNPLLAGNIKDLPSGVTYLRMNNNPLLTGNIKDLPSGITTLSLDNCSSVTGNIKDLPSGVTNLSLNGSSSITGTLESYVEKLYNAHKNDGKDFTLPAHTEDTRVTFNGASAKYLSTTTISGGKATVRKGSEQGNILGTYDGTSWTYNS